MSKHDLRSSIDLVIRELILRWSSRSRSKASSSYHEDIEAMLGDYAELVQRLQRDRTSCSEILFRLILEGADCARGIAWLTLQRYRRGLSLFLYALDELLTLSAATGAFKLQRPVRTLIRLLHRVTGSVGSRSESIRLSLDLNAHVTAWDKGAETLFGFRQEEVLSKDALSTFIPLVETGGRTLRQHILNICTFPEQFSLNLNENQDAEGNKFWVFWVNVPLRQPDGSAAGISCVGIKSEDQELMGSLAHLWQRWQQSRYPHFPNRGCTRV